VDLVAAEAGALVAVEVKTGTIGPRFRPGMRVDERRVRRLRRAARELARGAVGDVRSTRVDLVEVRLGPGGRLAGIAHLRDLRRAPFPAAPGGDGGGRREGLSG